MRLFHEKSAVGNWTGNPRDFDNEYTQVEPEENPKDAQEWLVKGQSPEMQQKWEQNWQNLIKIPGGWRPGMAKVYFIGQSHMDMAWLWRFLQTVDKTRVTFSKACFHIKNIPEFSFIGSQSVMFEWCRLRYPELFQQIKDAVATGRFELAGGSWVEPDCHIPSGESWARQRLYGQLFYKKHFGRYATIDWVPDSFGFTQQLPQILAKSNTKRFFTGKLDSNEDTRFSFRTFWWQSPDGTRILAESTAKGLESWAELKKIKRLLKPGTQAQTPAFSYESIDSDSHPNLSDDINPHLFFLYGVGDGGHGPTGQEVQERLYHHRAGHYALTTAEKYFEAVELDCADRLPVWKDELYLETHQGSMTSLCLVKRMNRFNEWMLPSLESLCVFAKLVAQERYTYPHDTLDEAWRVTLFNQFHDVLPGTCIPEVYDDVYNMWLWQTEEYEKIRQEAFRTLYSNSILQNPSLMQNSRGDAPKSIPFIAYNPTSYQGTVLVEIPLNQFPFRPIILKTAAGEKIQPFFLPEIPCTEMPFYALPGRLVFPWNPQPFGVEILTALGDPLPPLESHPSSIHHEMNEDTITITNGLLSAVLDCKTGAINSLRFRCHGEWQETLQQGPKQFDPQAAMLPPGIIVHMFHENSLHFPAWNMDKKSRQHPYAANLIYSAIAESDAQHITVKTHLQYATPHAERPGETNTSELVVSYTLVARDPLLYLTFDLHFQGQKTMMKLDIPTSTNASRVDAEIAYGYDNRSTLPITPRDQARFENIMHSFVNLQATDNRWGLSILNNGKYGVDYHQGYVGVTLIHGQPYFPPRYTAWVFEERFEREDNKLGTPPGWTDQGHHIFRLAIYPHEGDLQSAQVVQKAHMFNALPLTWIPPESMQKAMTNSQPNFPRLPTVNSPLEISSIKFPHRDGDCGGINLGQKSLEKVLILRAVNYSDKPINGKIDLSGLNVINVNECDLLERKVPGIYKLDKNQGSIAAINASWNPFEFKTFALELT